MSGAGAAVQRSDDREIPTATNATTIEAHSATKWSLSGGHWVCIGLWSAAWATTLVPAGPDEPLTLRWLRACADHPLRTALAGLLIAGACSSGAKGRRAGEP